VHLKKKGVLVSKNDTVKKGQVIGYSGNTGMSTEAHLHFAVYKPTKNGLVSIPYILDSIPTEKYKKGKFAFYN
jgi:murein DD-endopeptidase MepM/ murein hydrolase activator NlpD